MADRLYLSYWLRDFNELNMLDQFEKLLRKFPYTRLGLGVGALRIYAIEYAEPPLVEQAFTEAPAVDTIVASAREFQNPDCAYLVESSWDLWRFEDEWKLKPTPVSLDCYGPEFGNDIGDHFRLELGPDSIFIPQPEIPGSGLAIQSNLRSVVQLAHELDKTFKVERRQLWTESGENFLELLQETL